MASNYDNIDVYKVIKFLAKYSWIFDFQMTRFFADKVWKNIPHEWTVVLKNLSFKDLAGLPFGGIQEGYPESLKDFMLTCMEYSLSKDRAEQKADYIPVPNSDSASIESPEFTKVVPLNPLDIDADIRLGMSAKKIHEICHITSLINQVIEIERNNAVVNVGSGNNVVVSGSGYNVVVDVGSGLGYLGQVLHSVYGHIVLGLEGKHGHTAQANKRFAKTNSCCLLQNVTCELYPTQESKDEFLKCIDWLMKFPPGELGCSCKPGCKNSCMTGSVHVCKSNNKICHQSGSQTDVIAATSCKNSDTMAAIGLQTFEKSCFNMQDDLTSICENTDDLTSLCKKRDDLTSIYENKNEVNCNLETNISENIDKSVCICDEGINFAENCNEYHESSCISLHNATLDAGIGNYFKSPCYNSLQKACALDFINNSKHIISIVGLHCCGDLTSTMLRYFSELDCVRSLCCVSCCYHRMKYDEDRQQYVNFPMSHTVSVALQKVQQQHPKFRFSPYSMRLAAQETRIRWRNQSDADHSFHSKNVAYRSLLELYLIKENCHLQKTARKLAHRSDYDTFQQYIDAVYKHLQVSDFESSDGHRQCFVQQMKQLYTEHEDYLCLIEPFTALQYLVQPVLESLIHLDRQIWLTENGYQCHIVPVFDEYVSPRNVAIVAIK